MFVAAREELKRSQEVLQRQAEEIRQQHLALKREQEAMVAQCRHQLSIQQEQFNNERYADIRSLAAMVSYVVDESAYSRSSLTKNCTLTFHLGQDAESVPL